MVVIVVVVVAVVIVEWSCSNDDRCIYITYDIKKNVEVAAADQSTSSHEIEIRLNNVIAIGSENSSRNLTRVRFSFMSLF